jgi:hypothetical protein
MYTFILLASAQPVCDGVHIEMNGLVTHAVMTSVQFFQKDRVREIEDVLRIFCLDVFHSCQAPADTPSQLRYQLSF